MNKQNFLIFYITLVFSVFKALLSIVFAFILKNLLDHFGTGTLKHIYNQILLSILFLIFYLIVETIYNYLESKYIIQKNIDLKRKTISTILNSNIIDFNNKHSGEYLSLIINDSKVIEDNYYSNILECISTFLNLIFSVISLLFLNFILGTVSVFSTIFFMIIPIIISNKLNIKRKNFSKKQDDFTRETKSILDGFETIKNYNVENLVLDDYYESINTLEYDNQKLRFFLQSSSTLGRLMGFLVFFIIIFTGLLLSIKGTISFGVLLASIQLSNNLISPIISGVNQLVKINSVKDIRKKFQYFINNQKKTTPTSTLSFNRSIKLNNLSFSYDHKNLVLKDITISIEKGKKYAIVGSSGSGKSTLGKVIMGMFDNYSGNIIIDEQYIDTNTINQLSKLFSVINQNIFLFNDTIENNISFYKNISINKINETLEQVDLGYFIGHQEYVGENGKLLSSGERQRISLARAFLNDCPIILLDEATSHLDNENMIKIENLVTSSSKTIITITHRLTEKILKKYDMIYVMSQGKIIEYGTYNDLINQKGLLYSLYYISNT